MAGVVLFGVLTFALWPDSGSLGKKPRAEFAGGNGFLVSVAFSPDGKTLAYGNREATIGLASAIDGSPIGVLPPGAKESGRVYPLIFSRDGKRLIAANASHPWDSFAYRKNEPTVKVWDVDSRRLHGQLRIPDQGYAFRLLPDDQTLAVDVFLTNESELVRRYDLVNARQLSEILVTAEGPDLPPLGQTQATPESINARKTLAQLIGGRVGMAIVSPDGKSLAASSPQAPLIQVVDLEQGKIRATIPGRSTSDFGSAPTMIHYSSDSSCLLVSRLSGFELWDLKTGTQRWRFPLIGEFSFFEIVHFSEQGGRVVLAGGVDANGYFKNLAFRFNVNAILGTRIQYDVDAKLVVLDVATGRVIERIHRRDFRVADACLSWDGRSVAAVGVNARTQQNSILIWDVLGESSTNVSVSFPSPERRPDRDGTSSKAADAANNR